MIPARYAPVLFALIVSGMMSLIVTGIATVRAVGFGPNTLGDWMGAWALSWPVAFSVILIVSPFVRRLVARLVRSET